MDFAYFRYKWTTSIPLIEVELKYLVSTLRIALKSTWNFIFYTSFVLNFV